MRGRGEGGIRQRARADVSVYWEARVTIHGRRVSFYDDAKTAAQAKACQARADAERGVPRPTESLTVEAYLRHWLETSVRRSVRVRLAQVTPGHIQGMLARIVEAGRTENTARRVRATLSAALRAAQLDYGLPRNAASLAKVPKSD